MRLTNNRMEPAPSIPDDEHSSEKQPIQTSGVSVSLKNVSHQMGKHEPGSVEPQVQSPPCHDVASDARTTKESSKISTLNEQSLLKSSSQDVDHPSTNHKESNVKLKRCKHGRIIIKDLSKKKFSQQKEADISGMHSPLSKFESNNNHIDRSKIHCEEHQRTPVQTVYVATDRTIININNDAQGLSPHRIPSLPKTPPPLCEKSKSSIKSAQPRNKHRQSLEIDKDTHKSDSWSASSSGSSVSTTLHRRRKSRSRTPLRRSRSDRSPRLNDRTSSRRKKRRRGRKISSSPRYRGRSPISRRSHRSSSQRRRRSPDWHRHSGSHSHRRRSPQSRSPTRLSRSRTRSPSDQDRSYRYSRRQESRSPSREKYVDGLKRNVDYDKKSDRYDKPSRAKSPRDHPKAPDSKANDSHFTASQEATNDQSLRTESKLLVSRLSPQNHLVSSQPSSKPLLHEEKYKNMQSSSSSMNVAADDSVASDIYDPEGPIIPISPGDSPPSSPIDDAAFNNRMFQPTIEKPPDDDVPSSAVQLNQQEKYLQKLNRQERVVEEVKIALKPFYQNRTIDKEQYKDVLRKAVPKICHSKNGEINPVKIRSLIEAYVKKMR